MKQQEDWRLPCQRQLSKRVEDLLSQADEILATTKAILFQGNILSFLGSIFAVGSFLRPGLLLVGFPTLLTATAWVFRANALKNKASKLLKEASSHILALAFSNVVLNEIEQLKHKEAS